MDERKPNPLARHRWWLALAAVLLTPWIGPHVDGYLPIAGVLLRATQEDASLGFWVLAGGFVGVGYVAWFLLLTLMGAWWSRRGNGK